jgi:hypothetical protein
MLGFSYKQSTSPPTKIFVSQVTRMSEYAVDFVRRTRRPRIMYIDAAKRMGASKMSVDWMMYGVVDVVVVWAAARAE